MSSINILFEDNHIIAVNKRPGEIVQGDKTGDKPLCEFVRDYIRDACKKPGNVFTGVVHRIDRPVSGVVLFAKTSKALVRLNEMLKEREIKKVYWAVVDGDPGSEGHLIHFLKKNQQRNISKAYEKEIPGSLRAELKYEKIASSDKYHLLKVHLMTGRHHQIRSQLSFIGCPIKGDLKYGSRRGNGDGSIHLHAGEASFMHPVKKEMLCIKADPPADSLWNFFLGRIK